MTNAASVTVKDQHGDTEKNEIFTYELHVAYFPTLSPRRLYADR